MPRAQRWNSVYSSFRAGQLSPAAQDDLSSDVWANGAARIENFRLERDGGLSPRPALRRSPEITLDVPTRGMLAGAQIVKPGGGASVSPALSELIVRSDFYSRADLLGAPYGKDGGVFRIGREFATNGAVAGTPLVRVVFPRPVAPLAFTFHGVRLVEGDRTFFLDDVWRLNLAVWLGLNVSNPADGRWASETTGGVGEPREPGGTIKYENELAPGAFSPGSVRRDLVIPMDRNVEQPPRPFVKYVELRTRITGKQVRVSIDGISCFGSNPAEGVALPAGVLDRPHRIIPWAIRGIPFVLMLGMDHVRWVQLYADESRPPQSRVSGTAVWHFTARQLRELTWATYGGDLLLCHHDFPHPLLVRIPLGGERSIVIEPLELINVPFVSDELERRALPDVSGVGGEVVLAPVGTPGGVIVPIIGDYPTRVRLGPTSAEIHWEDTGADAYLLEWVPRGGTQAASDEASGTVFEIFPLIPGTTYQVRRRARVGADLSAWSPYATVETLKQLAAPDAPALVATPNNVEGEVGISWNEVGDADYYELVVSGVPTPIPVRSGTSTVLTLSAGSTYNVQVRAVAEPEQAADIPQHWSTRSTGGLSEASSVTLRNFQPGRVARPTVVAGAEAGQLLVSWPAVPGADRYEIQHQQLRIPVDVSFTQATTATVESNSATIAGVAGRDYQVRVRAIRDHADEGDWSEVVGFLAESGTTPTTPDMPDEPDEPGAPDAPTLDVVQGTSDGALLVSWDDIAGATGYHLEWRLGTGSWTRVERTAAQRTWTRIFTPGSRYGFRVRAVTGTVEGGWSDIETRLARNLTPAQVQDLALRAVRHNEPSPLAGQTVLSWSVVAQAGGYEWEQYSSASLAPSARTSRGTTTTALTSRANGTEGTRYWYRVRATRANALPGEWSETGSFVAEGIDSSSVAGPDLSVVEGDDRTKADLSWTAVAGARDYLLQSALGTGSFTQALRTADASVRSHTFTGASGTTRRFRVHATFAGADPSAWSPEETWLFRRAGPTLTATDGDVTGEVDLSWTAVTGHTAYRVQARIKGTVQWENVGGINQAARTVTYEGRSFGTYEFRVAAAAILSSSIPRSEWSDIEEHTIRQAGPILTATGGQRAGEIVLSWTAVTGATAYTLQQRAGTSGAWTDVTGFTGRGHTVRLTPGTAYEIRVRATVGSLETSWGEASFTAPVGITTAPTATLVLADGRNLFIHLGEVVSATQYSYRLVVGGTPRDWVDLRGMERDLAYGNLFAGTAYSFQFRAANSLGAGPPSATMTFSTVSETGQTPAGFSMTGGGRGGRGSVYVRAGGEDTGTFEWQPRATVRATLPAGATGWDIQYSSPARGQPEFGGTTPFNVEEETGSGSVSKTLRNPRIAVNRIYAIRIRAKYGRGVNESPWTSPSKYFLCWVRGTTGSDATASFHFADDLSHLRDELFMEIGQNPPNGGGPGDPPSTPSDISDLVDDLRDVYADEDGTLGLVDPDTQGGNGDGPGDFGGSDPDAPAGPK